MSGDEFFYVVSTYSYTARSEKELSLQEGEYLRVLQDRGEWYFGEIQSGQRGYIPAEYVQVVDDAEAEDVTQQEDSLDSEAVQHSKVAVALVAFHATVESELSVKPGDKLAVLCVRHPTMWVCTPLSHRGPIGRVPKRVLRVHDNVGSPDVPSRRAASMCSDVPPTESPTRSKMTRVHRDVAWTRRGDTKVDADIAGSGGGHGGGEDKATRGRPSRRPVGDVHDRDLAKGDLQGELRHRGETGKGGVVLVRSPPPVPLRPPRPQRPAPPTPANLAVGTRVLVGKFLGDVRFLGTTSFGKEGLEWVGVELDDPGQDIPLKLNDGSVCGVPYFTCRKEGRWGLFVRPSQLMRGPVEPRACLATPEEGTESDLHFEDCTEEEHLGLSPPPQWSPPITDDEAGLLEDLGRRTLWEPPPEKYGYTAHSPGSFGASLRASRAKLGAAILPWTVSACLSTPLHGNTSSTADRLGSRSKLFDAPEDADGAPWWCSSPSCGFLLRGPVCWGCGALQHCSLGEGSPLGADPPALPARRVAGRGAMARGSPSSPALPAPRQVSSHASLGRASPLPAGGQRRGGSKWSGGSHEPRWGWGGLQEQQRAASPEQRRIGSPEQQRVASPVQRRTGSPEQQQRRVFYRAPRRAKRTTPRARTSSPGGVRAPGAPRSPLPPGWRNAPTMFGDDSKRSHPRHCSGGAGEASRTFYSRDGRLLGEVPGSTPPPRERFRVAIGDTQGQHPDSPRQCGRGHRAVAEEAGVVLFEEMSL